MVLSTPPLLPNSTPVNEATARRNCDPFNSIKSKSLPFLSVPELANGPLLSLHIVRASFAPRIFPVVVADNNEGRLRGEHNAPYKIDKCGSNPVRIWKFLSNMHQRIGTRSPGNSRGLNSKHCASLNVRRALTATHEGPLA